MYHIYIFFTHKYISYQLISRLNSVVDFVFPFVNSKEKNIHNFKVFLINNILHALIDLSNNNGGNQVTQII